MKIDEFYTVEADGSNWTLSYRKEGEISEKTGKPVVSQSQSYHSNLGAALRWYLHECLKPSQDIRDVVKRIEEAERNIERMVKQ